jgi:drug/metabolite transporter (DMT)-like permease
MIPLTIWLLFVVVGILLISLAINIGEDGAWLGILGMVVLGICILYACFAIFYCDPEVITSGGNNKPNISLVETNK